MKEGRGEADGEEGTEGKKACGRGRKGAREQRRGKREQREKEEEERMEGEGESKKFGGEGRRMTTLNFACHLYIMYKTETSCRIIQSVITGCVEPVDLLRIYM